MATSSKLFLAAACCLAGCSSHPGPLAPSDINGPHRLPTGATLAPVGAVRDVGPYPFTMVPAPGGTRLILLLPGYRDNGIQVLDAASGTVLQTLPQPAAFVGVAFDPS